MLDGRYLTNVLGNNSVLFDVLQSYCSESNIGIMDDLKRWELQPFFVKEKNEIYVCFVFPD